MHRRSKTQFLNLSQRNEILYQMFSFIETIRKFDAINVYMIRLSNKISDQTVQDDMHLI